MMSPSRIKSASGAAEYYAKDDYYIEGEAGAPSLEWGGKASGDLDLQGKVSAEALRDVLEGRNPNADGPALTATENKAKHHAGWDFTFAVPKSVTLLVVAAEQHDPALADRLKDHILAANAKMMGYLEANHAVTRVRDEDGGVREVQTGNLLYASVMHVTTRGGDPHIHVHNPIANTTKNPETGQYGALETRHMYKWQKNTSLVGARELQDRLMGEGFNIERKGELGWELAGSSPALLAEFSTRSREINEAAAAMAKERGVSELTDEQRTMIQKQTRKAKGEIVREVLHADWADRAEKAAPGALAAQLAARGPERGQDVTPTVEGRMNPVLSRLNQIYRDHVGANRRVDHYTHVGRDPDREAQQLVSMGVRVAEAREAVVSKHLILQRALVSSGAGVRYERLEESFDRLREQGHLVAADAKMLAGVTTSRTLDRENQILEAIENGKGKAPKLIAPAAIDAAMDPKAVKARVGLTLTAGQDAGTRSMLGGPDRYAAVEGYAGVGKSTAFRVLKDVADRHDVQVYGLATQHAYVRTVKEAGLQARTVESFLRITEAKIQEGGEGLAKLKRDFARTIFVVDEASTLTNDTALRLTRVWDRLEAPAIRIAGDRGQLGGQGAGNPFKAMLDRGIANTPITEIQRQRNAPTHIRKAIQNLAEGKVKDGLSLLRPNIQEVGRDATHPEIAQRVVDTWIASNKTSSIVVTTNVMRDLVSAQVRGHLQEAGEISKREVDVERLYQKYLTRAELTDSRSYALGDKIVDTSAFRGVGTARRIASEVVGIDHANNLLKVKSERGPDRVIDLNQEADRKDVSFTPFTARVKPIAVGDRMVWEARFSDRGYERGAAFTILGLDQRSITIQHAAEPGKPARIEQLDRKDEALRFSGYGYATTADRAQGSTFQGVIFELTTKAGEAANQARLYVQASRTANALTMVTDDLARVSQLILRNDGKKPVALDHLRGALDALKRDDAAKAPDLPHEKDRDLAKGKDLDRGMGSTLGHPGADRQRAKTREQDINIQQQQNMGL